jgi:dephospho-CoA kinase
MIAPDGSLRRDLLARRVFPDAAARKTLEAILHPRIRQLWRSRLAQWRSGPAATKPVSLARVASEADDPTAQYSNAPELQHSNASFFCVVIPLLFETHAETEVDATLCVACSAVTQHQRLSSRGWNADQINQRIKSQLPIEEKMARADYVIWNEASLDVLLAQLDCVLGFARH